MIYKGKKYYISALGYYCRDERINGKRKTVHLHRQVWEEKYGLIPEGMHIHHRDGNSLNNDISNLECLPQPAHASLHRQEEYKQGDLNYLLKASSGWAKKNPEKKKNSLKKAWETRRKNLKAIQRKCKWCKNLFETTNESKVYCSRSCIFKRWWHQEG